MGGSCVTLVLQVLAVYCLVSVSFGQKNWWENLFDRDTTSTSTATPIEPTCPCINTLEYNPICGTDGVTYTNKGKLQCAQQCGKNVQVQFYGACEPVT